MRKSAVVDVVEFMDGHLKGSAGWSDAEPFAGMGSSNDCTHGSATWRADDLQDPDSDVRKGRDKFSDKGLHAIATRLLVRCKRNILPVGRHGFVEKVRVPVAEGPVKRLHGALLFRRKAEGLQFIFGSFHCCSLAEDVA